MKRGSPKRDWTDSVAKLYDEACCRVCGSHSQLQQAHTAWCKFDQPKPGRKTLWVNPLDTVPLCLDDHLAYDAGNLDLLGYLTVEEQVRVVQHLGGIEAARMRLAPLAYRSNP